jgi:hypothetical protein
MYLFFGVVYVVSEYYAAIFYRDKILASTTALMDRENKIIQAE